jgi:hypothetical protein
VLERSAVLVDLRGVTRHIDAAARSTQMATTAKADEQLVEMMVGSTTVA